MVTHFFLPPDHLSSKDRKDWSRREAREYLDWFLEVQQSRIGKLTTYLEEPRDRLSPQEHLLACGKKAAELFVGENFTSKVDNGRSHLELPSGFAFDDEKAAVVSKLASIALADARGRKSLTNAGNSLAVDMAILTTGYLLDARPDDLKWETSRKRGKREVSYNLPVLVGKISAPYIEPIRVSTVIAMKASRGDDDGSGWKNRYKKWLEL